MPLEACYYGDRKVIYVQIRYPDHKNGSKLVSVYGHSFKEVVRAIEHRPRVSARGLPAGGRGLRRGKPRTALRFGPGHMCPSGVSIS